MKFLVPTLLLTFATAQAHNNLFFPGDAHFPTTVTEDFLKSLKNEGQLKFDYESQAMMTAACGYAGIRYAMIEKLPNATRDNLVEVLSGLFAETPFQGMRKETEEGLMKKMDALGKGVSEAEAAKLAKSLKYFPIFIYNRDFDFNQHAPLLRYNENFETEQTQKAETSDFVDDLLFSPELKLYDEKHAKHIRALDAKKYPASLRAFMGVDEPVVLDGSKIVFVIPLGHSVWEHATTKAGAPSIFKSADKAAENAPERKLELLVIGQEVRRITYR